MSDVKDNIIDILQFNFVFICFTFTFDLELRYKVRESLSYSSTEQVYILYPYPVCIIFSNLYWLASVCRVRIGGGGGEAGDRARSLQLRCYYFSVLLTLLSVLHYFQYRKVGIHLRHLNKKNWRNKLFFEKFWIQFQIQFCFLLICYWRLLVILRA